MRLLPRLVVTLATSAALAGLAGCGSGIQNVPGGSGTPARDAARREVQPARAHPAVYVAQANGGATGVAFAYKPDNQNDDPPVCMLRGQRFVASDIGSDQRGNLYLPNVVTSRIDVYRPDCGKLLARIADPFGSPIGVVIHDGGVYVANGNNVAVCSLKGCASALTDPNVNQITSVAVDAHGNVWAAHYDQQFAVSLIVWPHGAMPGHELTGYTTGFTPGGILFDAAGTLVTVVSHSGAARTFTCSITNLMCTVTGSFALLGRSEFGALNSANTEIQITDTASDAVDVFAYPSFIYEYSYSAGLLAGYSPEGITQAP